MSHSLSYSTKCSHHTGLSPSGNYHTLNNATASPDINNELLLAKKRMNGTKSEQGSPKKTFLPASLLNGLESPRLHNTHDNNCLNSTCEKRSLMSTPERRLLINRGSEKQPLMDYHDVQLANNTNDADAMSLCSILTATSSVGSYMDAYSFVFPFFQEMVSVESFIELVKKRDIGRLKFAIRETNFDIDSRDEVSFTFPFSCIRLYVIPYIILISRALLTFKQVHLVYMVSLRV